MSQKDERIKIINEVLNGIKVSIHRVLLCFVGVLL